MEWIKLISERQTLHASCLLWFLDSIYVQKAIHGRYDMKMKLSEGTVGTEKEGHWWRIYSVHNICLCELKI